MVEGEKAPIMKDVARQLIIGRLLTVPLVSIEQPGDWCIGEKCRSGESTIKKRDRLNKISAGCRQPSVRSGREDGQAVIELVLQSESGADLSRLPCVVAEDHH